MKTEIISDGFYAQKLSKSNIHTAIRLCDEFVGKDMYEADELLNIMSQENCIFRIIMRGSADTKEPVGYFYCYHTCDNVSPLKNIKNENVTQLCKDYGKIGVFQSIGICEKYRKTGLSDALLKHFFDLLKSNGCGIIIAPAWEKGDFIPAKKLLLRNGYSYCCSLYQPWISYKQLKCPYCKQSACICNAAVFYKKA